MNKPKLVSEIYSVSRPYRDAVALEKANMMKGLSERAHQHLYGAAINHIGNSEFEIKVPYSRTETNGPTKMFDFLDSVIQEAYDALILT